LFLPSAGLPDYPGNPGNHQYGRAIHQFWQYHPGGRIQRVRRSSRAHRLPRRYPLALVPLDVTYRCILSPQDVQRLQKIESPITHFIAEATRFYMDFHDEFQRIQGCVINDPLALALAFIPELVSYQDLYIDVDISGGVLWAILSPIIFTDG
jgi:hypothetical protein